MTVLINPGSGPVAESGNGWTNTYTEAEAEAQRWLRRMHEDGIIDVQLTLPGTPSDAGRWVFEFQHEVTRKVVKLETPGIDNMAAYEKERIFPPRVYWKGSSSSDPEIEHWAADGFEVTKTFRRKGAAS